MFGIYGLKVLALWNGKEDGCGNRTDDERADDGLDEDGVLNRAESGFLNPYFTIEYLADDIALVVFSDPRLVLVAVA